jgi:hypothetical protein
VNFRVSSPTKACSPSVKSRGAAAPGSGAGSIRCRPANLQRTPSSGGSAAVSSSEITISVTTGPGAITHCFLTGLSSQCAASASAIDASADSSPLTAAAQAATASRAALPAMVAPNHPSPAWVIAAAAAE